MGTLWTTCWCFLRPPLLAVWWPHMLHVYRISWCKLLWCILSIPFQFQPCTDIGHRQTCFLYHCWWWTDWGVWGKHYIWDIIIYGVVIIKISCQRDRNQSSIQCRLLQDYLFSVHPSGVLEYRDAVGETATHPLPHLLLTLYRTLVFAISKYLRISVSIYTIYQYQIMSTSHYYIISFNM